LEVGYILEGLDLSEHLLSFETIKTLTHKLQSLKELGIGVGEVLSPEAADLFKKLEKLHLSGCEQSSSFVKALIPNIPSIKGLRICVQRLSPKAGNAFRRCKGLEKLYLNENEFGFEQSSLFVGTLIPNLPSLKELQINVKELSPEAGDAFEGCKRLEKLYLRGSDQSPLFVEALVPNLPSIKELCICVEELSQEAGGAFEGCKRLECLNVRGHLTSGFFEHILSPPLTYSLKTLTVYKSEGSERLSDEDDQAIAAARLRSTRVNIHG
jgi:hypothetical protein